MSATEVRDLLARTGMPAHTPYTITNEDDFAKALTWTTEHGYALDEGEQEIGVRCVAVAIPDTPARLALSVSGPAPRMTEALIERAVPLLREAGMGLSHDLK